MKVAFVYDRVNKWGGAERVLLQLHKMFPDAPLFTSVYNYKTADWVGDFTIKTSFLQNIPAASKSHELFASVMPIAFESFSFDEYDLVISVTSEAAKGILTKPKTLHVCYSLTPTRYLWSGYEQYFQNKILRFISFPVISYLRRWDQIAAARPDFYIAISKEVKARIRKYYTKESEVVYPPVCFGKLENHKKYPVSNTSYFLVVSRLIPYKRIDIAIEACNALKLPLKIIGVGSEIQKLQSLAGPTVEFLGSLTDSQLVRYYSGCRALLFPSEEDFGLTVLEAQSCGKPVIAYARGGALETILKGKTGEFFYPQTKEALIKKLYKFEDLKYNRKDCINQANRFTNGIFEKQFMQTINRFFKMYSI